MAWFVAVSLVLCAGPAVFAEVQDPAETAAEAAAETAGEDVGEQAAAGETEELREEAAGEEETGPAAEEESVQSDPAQPAADEEDAEDEETEEDSVSVMAAPGIEVSEIEADSLYEIKLGKISTKAKYSKVRFRVWSTFSGGDDVREYVYDEALPKDGQPVVKKAVKNSKGKTTGYTYTAEVSIDDFKHYGGYRVEAANYDTDLQDYADPIAEASFATSVPAGGTLTAAPAYSKGRFTVTLTGMQNPAMVSKVKFEVWSTADKSDVRTYTANRQSNGSYARKIWIANHSYAGNYQVCAYAVDTRGDTRQLCGTACDMAASAKVSIRKVRPGEYRITVTGIRYPGAYKKVKLAVYSKKKGKDDIRWFSFKKKKSGRYTVDFSLSDCKHYGSYSCELYVVDAKKKKRPVTTGGFTILEPSGGKMTITSVSIKKGKFKAVMKGLKNTGRLKKVRFKVTNTAGYTKWYTAKKQKDGSYAVKVRIKNHGGKRGIYTVTGFTLDKKNDYELQSSATCNMSRIRKRGRGIDVSHWNGEIDWEKVKKAGINYAIIRCGYGDNIVSQDDRQWERNIAECKRVGMQYGVYIYAHAQTVKEARREADHCIRLLKAQNAHPIYPVFYDLEDPSDIAPLSNKQLAVITAAWASRIKAAGYTPGVYSSLYWWNYKLTDPIFDRYPKWVAQWPKVYTSSSKCSYTGKKYMWQYGSDGNVPGINGLVDMNWAY